jgi:protease I
VDVPLDGANPGDFDALSLPGGVMNPDKLRMDPKAVKFARAFSTPTTGRCKLPGTLDGHRNWVREGEEDCFVAVSQNGPAKCRGSVDDQEVVVDGKLV